MASWSRGSVVAAFAAVALTAGAPAGGGHVASAHGGDGQRALARSVAVPASMARLGCTSVRRAHLNGDRRPELVCWVAPESGFGIGRLVVRLLSGKVIRGTATVMDHKSGVKAFIQADGRPGSEILLRTQRNSTSIHFQVIALRGQRLVKIADRIRMN